MAAERTTNAGDAYAANGRSDVTHVYCCESARPREDEVEVEWRVTLQRHVSHPRGSRGERHVARESQTQEEAVRDRRCTYARQCCYQRMPTDGRNEVTGGMRQIQMKGVI